MFEFKTQKSKPTKVQPTKVVPETKKGPKPSKCPNHKEHVRHCVDCERK